MSDLHAGHLDGPEREPPSGVGDTGVLSFASGEGAAA